MSPISLLEIALKNRLGKLPFPAPFGALYPSTLLADDIHLLPIEPRHIEPLDRRSPFTTRIPSTVSSRRPPSSRGMTLVSDDGILDAYGVSRLW